MDEHEYKEEIVWFYHKFMPRFAVFVVVGLSLGIYFDW